MAVSEVAHPGFEIGDVVDLDVLQRIQDTFSQAMGLAAMVVSKTGQPVTRASNFQPICQIIRSTDKGRARCSECDAAGGIQAFHSSQVCSYMCAGGLLDVAAPIVIEGEYLGGIYCGQVIPLETQEEHFEEIVRRNEFLGMSRAELKQVIETIPVLPRERINAAAEMLQLVGSYIVSLGVTNLTQARLLKQTREKAALQNALNDAQLLALQSQVNPHFLFNSLALVSYTANEERAPRTEEIAYCLSDLLRYSLRNMTKPIPLTKELEAVEHYLTIQKLRFGEQLQTTVSVDPAVKDIPILCMLLQPLVENAIIHGLEPLTRPVTIQIKAYPWLNGLMLEIEDNGAGIDPAIAEQINARSFTFRQSDRTSLGVQNVVRRLQGQYGDDFAFRVTPVSAGCGTRVVMFLPNRG